MAKEVSIKKNFIMNAFLNASSFIFPLITFPYVSRILQPAGIGKVSAAVSLLTYFAMVAQLGIPTYGIRACAQVRDDKEKLSKTVQEIFIINLIMSVFVYIAFFVALFMVNQLAEDRGLYLICSTTIIFNLIGVDWLYKALEQYEYITKRSLLFKVIALILVFVFIHNEGDYLFYGVTTIFAAAGSNVMNFIKLRKYVSLHRFEKYEFRPHIKPIAVFFAMSVATTVYTNLDTLMLKFMCGDTEVGYYNAAVKVKTVIVSLVTSIGTVLLPRVSYYIEKKMDKEFHEVTAKAFQLVIWMALPFTLYFIFYARDTILVLSGASYLDAVNPMQIIMPTVFLIGLTNVMGLQILVPQGREMAVLVSEVVGAIVDLVLNLILIPVYASAGAALGTLAAELAVLIVQFIALRGFMLEIMRKLRMWYYLLAGVAACAAMFAANRLPVSFALLRLIWTAAVFFGVYAAVLLLVKEPMTREALRTVKGKLHVRKS